MKLVRKFAKKVFDWFNAFWIDGKIHSTSVIENCTIAEHVRVGKHSYCANTFIGSNSYLAGFNIVNNTEIGKFCSIGSFVSIGPGMHPTSTFVSTSPVFFSPHRQCGSTFADKFYYQDAARTSIGNDVWIGNNVVILDNVKIGDGAVIAAGAIVNRDVAPYQIHGGVPAKLIRSRFTPDIVDRLLSSRWWDRDESWFRANLKYMHDIDLFLKKIEEE